MEPIKKQPGDFAQVAFDEEIYSLEAILRTCYLFTDRCYLYLARPEDTSRNVLVYLKPKDATISAVDCAHEFCNELIDQSIRRQVAAESGKIRELLVAQAFAEGNLLKPDDPG